MDRALIIIVQFYCFTPHFRSAPRMYPLRKSGNREVAGRCQNLKQLIGLIVFAFTFLFEYNVEVQMKNGKRLDKKNKENQSLIKNSANQISLPRINQNSKQKREARSRSKSKKQSHLDQIKNKLEAITKINRKYTTGRQRKKSICLVESSPVIKQKNRVKSINKNEGSKKSIPNPHRNEKVLKRRSVINRIQRSNYDQESKQNQVKILFNQIQDRLKSPLLSSFGKQAPSSRQNSIVNSLSKSGILATTDTLLASPRQQLLTQKTNANKDIKSMIATIGTEPTRLDEFQQRSQDSIKLYLNQKIQALNMDFYTYFKTKRPKIAG